MEGLIHDLDEEAKHNPKNKMNGETTLTTTTTPTTIKSTLSGDTTYDKAQTGMTGPSGTGGLGQGEYKCHGGGPDHHPDEIDCNYCHKK